MGLPVAVKFKGQKFLVRGLPDTLLAWMVIGLHRGVKITPLWMENPGVNRQALGEALGREALSRPLLGKIAHQAALAIVPGPCDYCEKTGLYLVGDRRLCSDHRSAGAAIRSRYHAALDNAQLEHNRDVRAHWKTGSQRKAKRHRLRIG